MPAERNRIQLEKDDVDQPHATITQYIQNMISYGVKTDDDMAIMAMSEISWRSPLIISADSGLNEYHMDGATATILFF